MYENSAEMVLACPYGCEIMDFDLGGCREGSDVYIGVFDYSLTTIGESIMEG